jgi:hypothetical protein
VKRASVIAFVGPSLSHKEARALGADVVLGPARQGDVWHALELRPRAIALVDGVFESQPSVWHHELLDALDEGVAVFGGASMGALRAAELNGHGMVGVGQIFRWVRDGVIQDDAEVALLHADSEHGYRPLTLAQVNVRHAAAQAQAARVLTARQAAALVRASGRIFYQERNWPAVLALLPAEARARWTFNDDLKSIDARETIRVAVAAGPGRAPSPRPQAPSSLVRIRRIPDARLQQLAARPDAQELVDAGLRRALLAGWARSLGLQVPPCATRLEEDVALERLLLDNAERIVPDGPSREEALADEARLRALSPRRTRRTRRTRES